MRSSALHHNEVATGMKRLPRRQSRSRASFLHDDSLSLGSDDDDGDLPPPIIDASCRPRSVVAATAVAVDGVGSSSSGSSSSDGSSGGSGYGRSDSSDGSDESSSSGSGRVARRANRATIDDARGAKEEEAEPTAHELAARVARRVEARFRRNLPRALSDDNVERDCVAPFETKEIVLGRRLGSGEFSHVYEIRSFRPAPEKAEGGGEDDDDAPSYSPEEVETRRHMKRRERYHDTKKACYALKHLRPRLLEEYSKMDYAQSASDLASEAEFLMALQHPNIIKLRGISSAGAGGFADGPKGYFLIIDRLDETLDARIKRWKKGRRRRNRLASSLKSKLDAKKIEAKMLLGKQWSDVSGKEGGGDQENDDDHGGREHRDKKKAPLISEEQVDVGLQISSALMYLHDKSIMFRDLKPQNIGFDVRGDVKLFDFGLATVMPIFGDPYENKYRMSGAGSPRYMAPEVLVDPPDQYNLKADVYTFGIVLWEIFSLEMPHSHIKQRDELVEFVVKQHGRPAINELWPDDIKEVLHLSFDADIGKRPFIQLFYNMLRFQLLGMRDGDGTKLTDTFIQRRRSYGSLKDLEYNAAEDDGRDQSSERFRERVKNAILSHVKSPPSSDATGDEHAPRRRRHRLREKFRLSVKSEE